MNAPIKRTIVRQCRFEAEGWQYADAGDDGEDEDSECTPPELVELVRDFYGGAIDLDPCSNRHSQVGALVAWRKSDDGLAKPWHGRVAGVELRNRYVNPPYSRGEPMRWLGRCALEYIRDTSTNTIALVKADTSTLWWSRHCWSACAVAFVDRRIPFVHPTRSENRRREVAKWPNALIYWGPHAEGFLSFFDCIAHGVLRDDIRGGNP